MADYSASPRVWVALGAANYLKGDNERCYEALRHARQLAPDFEQTYNQQMRRITPGLKHICGQPSDWSPSWWRRT